VPKQREDHLQNERKRVAEYRSERKRVGEYRSEQTKEGQHKIKEDRKSAQTKWEKSLFYQKLQDYKVKSRNTMRKLRDQRALNRAHISQGMHKMWSKRKLKPLERNTKKTVQRRSKELRRNIEMTGSPSTHASVVMSALSNLSPPTKEALHSRGVIASKGAVEVLDNLKATSEDIHGTDARTARCYLLTAITAVNSNRSSIARATGFDRRSVDLTAKYRQEVQAILYITMSCITHSKAISETITHRVQKFFLNPSISRPMPSKPDVIRVKVAPKQYDSVPQQVLEYSLKEVYQMFKKKLTSKLDRDLSKEETKQGQSPV